MILFTLSNGKQGIVSDEDADLVASTPWHFATDYHGPAHTTYPNGAHAKKKVQMLHRLVAERMQREIGQELTGEDIVEFRNGIKYNCMRENLVIHPRKRGKHQERREMQARRKELTEQGYLPCTYVAEQLGMTRTALLSQREHGRVSSIFFDRRHYMHPEITRAELLAYCEARPRMAGRKPCKALTGQTSSSSS